MKRSLMIREPDLSFESLHQELNNLLRDTFGGTDLLSSDKMQQLSTWRPAVELKQTEKMYTAKIQLPGVKKDDINIDLDSDFMTISAEIKEEKETKDEDEKIHACEFKYGNFVRTLTFDSPIKVSDSSAEYKDGILTIKMPKQKIKKSSSKRLSIK
jgi:HSP20 family protein